MNKHKFKIQPRDLEKKAKRVRAEGLVPANVFGNDKDSQTVQFDAHDFLMLLKDVNETSVIYLQLGKKEIPVLIEEIQRHPASDDFIHVSFRAVNLKEKIQTEIPIELVGKFELAEAVLVTVRDEVEVEALPTDLPEKFVLDISGLNEVGQSLTLADLDVDKDKVEIMVGEEGLEAPVVLVQEVKEEVEEEETPETEIIGEGEEEGKEGADEDMPAEEGSKEENEGKEE